MVSEPHPVLAAWPQAIRLIRAQRVLFVPLGISAAVKTILLVVALVAPFPPFSSLLAPFVRYFWGDIYLHYPFHLGLASRWFRRSDLLLPIFLEGLLIGMTALLTRHLLAGHPAKPRQAFAEVFQRYPAVTFLALLNVAAFIICTQATFFSAHLLFRKVRFFSQNPFTITFLVSFAAVVIVAALESLFTFAIPLCVLENRSWFRSLKSSFRIGARAYGWIFLTVLAVSLCYLPVIMVRQGSIRLVNSAWPELILSLYLVRIVVGWFIGTLLAVWATVYLVRSVGISNQPASRTNQMAEQTR